MRNTAISFLHRHRPDQLESLTLTDDDLFDRIVENEVVYNVTQAVGKLPPERRRIVEKILEGFTQQEISQAFGISPNTVKTQRQKAYQTLRNQLTELCRVVIIFPF